jgi:hypothetical protein
LTTLLLPFFILKKRTLGRVYFHEIEAVILCRSKHLHFSEALRMRLAGPVAWLLALLLPASLGLLEDLKAGLGGARAYLDNLLPMLSEGIKAVQVCFGVVGWK